MTVAIVGGGVAGLSAAYRLSQQGVPVVVFEGAPTLGGLAGSFDLGGHRVERFHHFICLGDHPYRAMIGELGLERHLRWTHTKMGLLYQGRLYAFGEPWELLLFPGLSLWERLRFGWGVFTTKSMGDHDWKAIEDVPVAEWLIQRFGRRGYEVVHKPLVELKFGEYTERLSAAWMWARIHRLGRSRTKLTQREQAGYLEGGSQMLVDALERAIRGRGGELRTQSPVQRILIEEDRVRGIQTAEGEIPCSQVISTVAFPFLLRLVEGVSNDYFRKAAEVKFIGVMSMILRLKQPLSRYFWTNISTPGVNLAGVIEYTNLNPCSFLGGDRLVYLPQYLPAGTERYRIPQEELLAEYASYLRMINPAFDESWVRAYYVHRERYAQPICEVGFTRMTPGIKTPIRGLFVTDSSQLHPEDRTISNSIGLGQEAARLAQEELRAGVEGPS